MTITPEFASAVFDFLDKWRDVEMFVDISG